MCRLRGGGCGASKKARGTDEVSFPAADKGNTYSVTLTEEQKQLMRAVPTTAQLCHIICYLLVMCVTFVRLHAAVPPL